MRLHQKAKEVNPAIIRKYLRMRSLVQWLQAAPHLKVAALREDARQPILFSVRGRFDVKPISGVGVPPPPAADPRWAQKSFIFRFRNFLYILLFQFKSFKME